MRACMHAVQLIDLTSILRTNHSESVKTHCRSIKNGEEENTSNSWRGLCTIFLGAGASAAFDIPTAAVLTTEMREMLSKEQQSLLDDITSFWENNYEGKGPNYENILTVLMGLTDPRRIARDSIVKAFVSSFKNHSGDYEPIIDDMYDRIVTYCTAPFVQGEKYIEPTKLEEIFQKSYDVFALFREEVIFTTNYDPSLEIWCQKRNIQIHDGSVDTRNPEIKRVLPIDEQTVADGVTKLYEEGGASLKIIRLHGSAWVYETEGRQKIKMNRPRDRLLFTDWYAHLNRKPYLIFPGQESFLASGDWDVYYQYLKKMLRRACLVIGYSFNDDLINSVFIDNVKKGHLEKIGIVDPHPDEVVKNLFWNQEIPSHLIIPIPTEFGTDQAVREIYNQWVQSELHVRFLSGVGDYLSNFRLKRQSYIG